MKELFLVVWTATLISSNCLEYQKTHPRYECETCEIKSKIVSSSFEASELYEQHKETAKVFKVNPYKIMPEGGCICLDPKYKGCENKELLYRCCDVDGVKLMEVIWKPIPTGEWVDKE